MGEIVNDIPQYSNTYIVDSLNSIFNQKLKPILKHISENNSLCLEELYELYITGDPIKFTNEVKKRKQNKKLSPCELCMARKADGEQCTRRRRDSYEYCGKHKGNLKYGRIDDNNISNSKPAIHSQNFIKCEEININGIDYLIDENKIVYNCDIDNPTIVGKYKDGELILADTVTNDPDV